jgi:hypothetical protein
MVRVPRLFVPLFIVRYLREAHFPLATRSRHVALAGNSSGSTFLVGGGLGSSGLTPSPAELAGLKSGEELLRPSGVNSLALESDICLSRSSTSHCRRKCSLCHSRRRRAPTRSHGSFASGPMCLCRGISSWAPFIRGSFSALAAWDIFVFMARRKRGAGCRA